MGHRAPPPRARRAEWVALGVLALPTVLIAMDLTVLHLAVPALSEDLRPSSGQLLWIVDIYGFLIAGSLITMGTLGDRIGRRRLLMIGAAAFGAASVLAALSTSAEMLIAARALLGVAGATLMPSTLSIIRNMFHDPGQRTLAISVWVTSFLMGTAAGPLVGGILLEHFWWGSVFLAGVPVMGLLLVLGPRLLPESRDPAPGRLDLTSVALSLVAILAAVYGIKRIAEAGASWTPALFIVAGTAVGAVFLRRQRGLSHPLLELTPFRSAAFSASLGAQTLALMAFAGTQLFIVQYLQLVLGQSPLEAGLWTLPATGGGVVGSLLAPLLVRYVRPAFVMGAGLALSTAGFVLLAIVDGPSALAILVAGSVVVSLGIVPTVTLASDMIVASAPPERAGAASAISETGTELGLALGVAVIGSVGTAAYRSEVTEALPPGVPPEAAEAARDTLGGAMTATDGLPADLAEGLLTAARDAFTVGLHATALTGAVLVAVIAALTTILLRDVRREAA